MPVYSLTSPQKLSMDHKQRLVDLFTDTHCGLTGAPEQFVHVLFSDGVPIDGGKQLYIHANVRFGRTPETVQQLRDALVNGSAGILGLPAQQVRINLLEIQAKWIMEGGHVMPEPGDEEEWMAKVHAALAERDAQPATVDAAGEGR